LALVSPQYVGGHSDLIAGACSGAALLEPIRGMRTILGTMCDPHTGWLLMRSLETLKLRMTAAAEGVRKVAAFLNAHPKVSSVWDSCRRAIPIVQSSSDDAGVRAPLSASKRRGVRPKPLPSWIGLR
jgi:cystathionine beta-lyase/cystathionine gamma-synthase